MLTVEREQRLTTFNRYCRMDLQQGRLFGMGTSPLEEADLDSMYPPSGLEGVKGYLQIIYWNSFLSE